VHGKLANGSENRIRRLSCEPDQGGGAGNRLRGKRILLTRDRDRPEGSRVPGQRAYETGGVFGLHHADDEVERPVVVPVRRDIAEDLAGQWAVTAAEP
jgi:hypothetical protein